MTLGHNRGRRLHEKEWWLAVGVMPHLTGVIGVITANAIDAIDGEALGITRNRQ
jgi:hypothetical protein